MTASELTAELGADSYMGNDTGVLLEHLFRHQVGRVVAHLARVLGPARLDLAEESMQEAMARALQVWPYHGIPENPGAWLFRVAHNAAIDSLRRGRFLEQNSGVVLAELKHAASIAAGDPGLEEQLRDDELRMIFMCCHPEISRDARVALSLKTVGGFGVREIASAFLADDAAIAQRLVRAKRQLRDRRVTLDLPGAAELNQRLDSALETVYFIFNEGYAAHEGEDLIRRDLCFEALRLGRLLAASSLATPRAHALVAVMALQAARLPARIDEAGDLILLEDQDRACWDQRLIALGFHHFDRSIAGDRVSEYHVQAAIAAIYTRAGDLRSIDWPAILELIRPTARDQRGFARRRLESSGGRSQGAWSRRSAGRDRNPPRQSAVARLLLAARGARAPLGGTWLPRGSRRLLARRVGVPLLGARTPLSAPQAGRR